MSVTLRSFSAIQLSLSHSFSHSLNTVNPFLSVPPPVGPSVFLHTQELKVETLIIPPVAIGVVDLPSCWHWHAIQIHPQLLVDVLFTSGPRNIYSPSGTQAGGFQSCLWAQSQSDICLTCDPCPPANLWCPSSSPVP